MFLLRWRSALLYLLLAVLVVPVSVILLVPTGIGVFALPVFFLLLLFVAYFAFIGASIKLGQLLIRRESEGAASLYLQGLLGFFILRAPVLLGRLLALLTSDVFVAVGGFLRIVGSVVLYVVLLYSVGAGFTYLRNKES